NDINKDAEITLVDETQGRYGDEEMSNTCVLDDDEVLAEPEEKANVVEAPSESITTTPTLTTTTAATTVTTASTKPKAKGLDKSKGIMVEEPMKIKKKDHISLDEELSFKLQAKLEEEDMLVRSREEEANIVAWDNVQAMIDADY
ncbi:hypothetical protein Tco_0833142, partial [Tanacetum coccineum]